MLSVVNARRTTPSVRAHNLLMLGLIYFRGNYYNLSYCRWDPIPQNFEAARLALERIHQEDNRSAWAEAQEILGEIYYHGKGVQRDFGRARQYFEQAAEQDANPDVQPWAWFYLGQIFMHAQGIEQPNYVRASGYFELAESQHLVPEVQALGWLGLGILYAGGHGFERDTARAREYFAMAMNQNVSEGARSVAEKRLEELDELEKKEKEAHVAKEQEQRRNSVKRPAEEAEEPTKKPKSEKPE